MTTSSDHRSPQLASAGDHWLEMTATLSPRSTEAFSEWLEEELADLEKQLEMYVTPRSLVSQSGRDSGR